MRSLSKLYLLLGLFWLSSAIAGFGLYRGGNVVCGADCGVARFTFWNNFYSDLGNAHPYHTDFVNSRLNITRPLFILNGIFTALMVFLAAALAAANEPSLPRSLTVTFLAFGFVIGVMLTVGAPSDIDMAGHRAGVAIATLSLAGLAWAVSLVYAQHTWVTINATLLLITLLYMSLLVTLPLNDVQFIVAQRVASLATLLNLGYLIGVTVMR